MLLVVLYLGAVAVWVALAISFWPAFVFLMTTLVVAIYVWATMAPRAGEPRPPRQAPRTRRKDPPRQ